MKTLYVTVPNNFKNAPEFNGVRTRECTWIHNGTLKKRLLVTVKTRHLLGVCMEMNARMQCMTALAKVADSNDAMLMRARLTHGMEVKYAVKTRYITSITSSSCNSSLKVHGAPAWFLHTIQ